LSLPVSAIRQSNYRRSWLTKPRKRSGNGLVTISTDHLGPTIGNFDERRAVTLVTRKENTTKFLHL
jgi:hypothetical protein